ncbi:MAG: hypothetical protein H7Y37_11695 [Anaerolineae bacterium]|nr:hypothetical protein [Gloeobacterales cyanobacterium ES-bin-313]
MVQPIPEIPGQKLWNAYERRDLRGVELEFCLPEPPIIGAAEEAAEALLLLRSALGLKSSDMMRIIETPIGTVEIRGDLLPHLVEKRLDQRERYANFILPTLANPYEIFETGYEDGSRRLRFFGVFASKYSVQVVVMMGNPEMFLWNFMHAERKKMNKNRSGKLIFPS